MRTCGPPAQRGPWMPPVPAGAKVGQVGGPTTDCAAGGPQSAPALVPAVRRRQPPAPGWVPRAARWLGKGGAPAPVLIAVMGVHVVLPLAWGHAPALWSSSAAAPA